MHSPVKKGKGYRYPHIQYNINDLLLAGPSVYIIHPAIDPLLLVLKSAF